MSAVREEGMMQRSAALVVRDGEACTALGQESRCACLAEAACVTIRERCHAYEHTPCLKLRGHHPHLSVEARVHQGRGLLLWRQRVNIVSTLK